MNFKLCSIDPFLRRCHDYVTVVAGKPKKRGNYTVWGKLEAAHLNQCRFGYIRSLKCHLVVMLGTRIEVVQALIWNVIAYLLPSKKQTTAVVKRDKTSGLDRNDCQKCSRLQRTLIRKGSIKYCLSLLWIMVCVTCLKISCISRCRVWNNICVHVCKTTNWWFICLNHL